jgi:hypothetical protein
VSEDLTYHDTEAILIRLGDTADRIVLVGGQAVNFWAWHYEARAVPLATYAPFTSKDVDIAAKREDVAVLAARLGGRARVADFDDHAPQAGTVVYVDEHGTERTLDVMATLIGLDMSEVIKTSVPFEYTTERGAPLGFRVMHPVLMLESRVHNILRFEKYRTPHGLRQLGASVLCAHEYLNDMVATDPRRVLNWNERIFRFRTRRHGRSIASDYQIDVFDAVLNDARLPAKFVERRYPQMVEAVDRLRAANR